MTYNPNIPQGPIAPDVQTVDVRTNFSQFDVVFGNNHSPLNSSRQGDHEAIVLEKQLSDPVIDEDLVAFYCKDVASKVSSEPQLFFKIPKFLPTLLDPKNQPSRPVQLTYNTVDIVGPIFQSFLPDGYLLFFGSTSNIAITITLPVATNGILLAIATPNTMTTAGTPIPFNVSTSVVNTANNNQFNIMSTLNAGGPLIPYSFTWMAVARA